jgi:hypothetical protein
MSSGDKNRRGSPCTESRTDSVIITRVPYHGWTDCLRISNGQVEAVVAPAVGRIMYFGFPGEDDGVFWENPLLEGKSPDPDSSDWLNFGGEKTWPAPQSDWPAIAGRPWPPPAAFDSSPYAAKVVDEGITLVSRIDIHYGIQVVRRISLHSAQPVMVVTTEYHKMSGNPVKVGIWIIAQTRDPQRVYVLLPSDSRGLAAVTQLTRHAPKDLKVEGRLLSLTRDPRNNVKIAIDGNAVLCMDQHHVLRMDACAGRGECHNGGRIEVYTNMDPLPYVELETAGSPVQLRTGDYIKQRTTYALARRTTADPVEEARRAFGLEAKAAH